jgi:hypothetical protein
MKTFNLTFCLLFVGLSILASIFCLIQFRIELGAVSFILGAISYVAYKDYKHPK